MVAHLQNRLGRSLLALGRSEQAVTVLAGAHRTPERHLGPDHANSARGPGHPHPVAGPPPMADRQRPKPPALDRLAQVWTATGRPEVAAKCRAELARWLGAGLARDRAWALLWGRPLLP
jgi:hypothetical protein